MIPDKLLLVVQEFLASRSLSGLPLLLGFSGGPDSLALLHLLKECRVNLHVAHVDHGWREESLTEAESLRAAVQALGLPFYLHKLEGLPHKEGAAREGRLKFFQKLYRELGCQALILGHQADDQAETVLKRILEGASLGALGGIRAVASFEGMRVWRPLLKVKKRVLEEWLQRRGLKPIEDETNRDPRYLRARMRTTLLPHLSSLFGKEVSHNLRRLGDLAQEMDTYLERQTDKYRVLVVETDLELSVDLTPLFPFEKLELHRFLKHFTEKNKIFLSYPALQTLVQLLERGGVVKKIGSEGHWVTVRGRSIAIKKPSAYVGQ